jgi:hypothetical protein
MANVSKHGPPYDRCWLVCLMRVWRIILMVLSLLLLLLAASLYFQAVQALISGLVSASTGLQAQATWPYRFRQAQTALMLLSAAAACLGGWVLPGWSRAVRLAGGLDRGVKRIFGRAIDLEFRPARAGWPKFQAIDWAALAVFFLYAALLFIGLIQGDFPHVPLAGDAANTASFAAGLDHPELFHGDMLLENPRNLLVYSTFNVYFMRWAAPLAGSYSLALAMLVPIQAFFNLLGFYLLGRILLPNRFWAFLLPVLLSFTMPINLGEFWGIPPDPVARYNFQAALPFVLCMVLVWRERPGRWPWIMAATGLLFYLHPVSTPTWAVAIWLSLLGSKPPAWRGRKHLGWMFLMGLIFTGVALPYVLTYLGNHVQGASASYDLILTVITDYFPPNLLDIPAAMGEFLPLVIKPGLLPLALGALIVLCAIPACRLDLSPVLLWIAGILLTAILLPWGMHSVERILRRIPMETELARGMRYLIPFMLLFVLWALAELASRIRLRPAALLAAGAGLAFTLGWGLYTYPPPDELRTALGCLSQGKLLCVPANNYELAIRAVRELTPPGAPVYATFANISRFSYGMPVRYNALRPLVYSNKDRGMLVYSNPAALQRWYDMVQATTFIKKNYDDENVMLKRHLVLARELGARYVITDLAFTPELAFIDPQSVIYRNDQFALIRLD